MSRCTAAARSRFTSHADGTQLVRSLSAGAVNLGASSDQTALRFCLGSRDAQDIHVRIGGDEVPVLYTGPANHFPGLDQVSVQVPRTLAGRGDVEVQLTVDGQTPRPCDCASSEPGYIGWESGAAGSGTGNSVRASCNSNIMHQRTSTTLVQPLPGSRIAAGDRKHETFREVSQRGTKRRLTQSGGQFVGTMPSLPVRSRDQRNPCTARPPDQGKARARHHCEPRSGIRRAC